MTRAAYTGTFDPITLGHVDVIERAAALFDHVVIAVARSSGKRPMFDFDERVELTREALAHLPNISVEGFRGLIVDFAQAQEVTVLVRGVRNVTDYSYEQQMAVMNRHLNAQVDTLMMAPSPAHAHISSTLVREIASMGGDVSELVSANVLEALKLKAV